MIYWTIEPNKYTVEIRLLVPLRIYVIMYRIRIGANYTVEQIREISFKCENINVHVLCIHKATPSRPWTENYPHRNIAV